MGKEVDPSDIGKFPGLIKSKFDVLSIVSFKKFSSNYCLFQQKLKWKCRDQIYWYVGTVTVFIILWNRSWNIKRIVAVPKLH